MDEPNLSEADIYAMTKYTNEIKSLGGTDQIGVVLSDKNIDSTFEAIKYGKKEFIKRMNTKLKMKEIDVIGELFIEKDLTHLPLTITLVD